MLCWISESVYGIFAFIHAEYFHDCVSRERRSIAVNKNERENANKYLYKIVILRYIWRKRKKNKKFVWIERKERKCVVKREKFNQPIEIKILKHSKPNKFPDKKSLVHLPPNKTSHHNARDEWIRIVNFTNCFTIYVLHYISWLMIGTYIDFRLTFSTDHIY